MQCYCPVVFLALFSLIKVKGEMQMWLGLVEMLWFGGWEIKHWKKQVEESLCIGDRGL